MLSILGFAESGDMLHAEQRLDCRRQLTFSPFSVFA
jgi:hypothetical protein